MSKSNLIYIMVDHQVYYRHGWDFGPAVRRPHFDQFAREGINFTHAYSPNPLCGPARRCILTGLYSHHHGEILNDVGVPYTDRTYLQILSDNGYRNYYFGKWHAGQGTAHDHGCGGYCYPSYGNPYLTEEYQDYLKEKQLPKPRIKIECTMDPWRLDIHPGEEYIQDKEWSNEQASGILLTPKETHEAFFLADQVCRQLEAISSEPSDEPFSVRVDFWGPHDPYFVTQEYADLYPPEDIPLYPSFDSPELDKPSCYRLEHNLGIAGEDGHIIYPNPIPWEKWQLLLSRCYAHTTMVDDAIGIILNKIKELRLDENTLIILTADHGDAIACQGGKFDKASYMVEEVMRIPFAMKWKGVIEAGQTTDALVSNLDAPVTMLAAAGLAFDYQPDGLNLLEQIQNRFRNRRKFFVSETYGHLHTNVAKSLVTERYKYTINREDLNELYDLAADPYELKNLIFSKEHMPLAAQFDAELRRWVDEQNDNFFFGTSEEVRQSFFQRATSKPRDY